MKSFKSKTLRLVGIGAALSLALAACGSQSGSAGSGGAGGKTLTKITTAVFQSELYSLQFFAKEKGFDTEHGLDVSFVTPSNGPAAAQLLLAGQIQAWFTDPLIILTAAAKGQDIKVGAYFVPQQQYWILVPKNSDLPASSAPFNEKMQALKGKKIGVSGIGSGTDHALSLGLLEAGVSADSVRRVGIGQQQAAIGQLNAGGIDGYVSFSVAGNIEIEKQTGARVYVAYGDSSTPAAVRDLPDGALAVSGDYAQKHPEVIASYLAALEEAYAWAQKNPDEAAAILNKYVFNGKDLALAKQVLPQTMSQVFAHIPPGFKMSSAAFDSGVSALRKLGVIPASSNLDFKSVVIPSAQGN